MAYKRIFITCISIILLILANEAAVYGESGLHSGSTAQLGTIVYHRIRDFDLGDIPGITRMKISADGSKIVFSGSNPKSVYTINADGTNLVKVFDYTDYSSRPPWIAPFIDIDSLGSTIMWTDGVGEIFVANSDGTNHRRIANEIPYQDTTVGPNIPLRPRITAKGDRIFFCNTSGDIESAGVWSVTTDSGSLTQLFKHSELMNLLNYEMNLYWANYAYNQEFDISGDGSYIVFGTFSTPEAGGKLMGFDGGLKVLFDYAPNNEGGLAISGNGNKIVTTAWRFDGRNPVWLLNSGGGEGIEIMYDAGGATVNFGTMPANGNVLIANQGFPISLVYTSYKEKRFELVNSPSMRDENEQDPFFSVGIGPVVSMTSDARRFCFSSIKEFGFSRQSQIWVADINPEKIPETAPVISHILMEPPYVAEQWKSSSTFSAKVSGNTGNVTFYPFKTGIGIGVLNSSYLYDNGPDVIPGNGDPVANDGIYTLSPVGTNSEVEDSPYSIRFSACNSQYVTSVEVAPFFVLKEVPSGNAPQISLIEPATASPGEQITITGTGFNGIAALNIVIIGNLQAFIISATATQLVVEVPTGLSPGIQPVTVCANGQTSNVGIVTIGGAPYPNLNPPQNLTAEVSNSAVLLSWDPPLMDGLRKSAGEIDEVEPNNTPEDAQVLAGSSPIVLNGKAEVADQGTIFLIDDIEDLFKVTTSAAGINLLLNDFTADCYLALFNQDGSEMLEASFTMGGESESLIIDAPDLAAGTYLIAVSIVDQNAQGVSEMNYSLTVTGQFEGEVSGANLLSYNIYRSKSRDARFTGALLGNVDASITTYSDNTDQNQQYFYQVTAVYDVGESGPSNEGMFSPAGISDKAKTLAIDKFELFQNSPNPFNSSTIIKYHLPEKTTVKLKIFNIMGQEVKTLVNSDQSAGRHSIIWHGDNNSNSGVTSGVYFYQLEAGKTILNRKMIFLE